MDFLDFLGPKIIEIGSEYQKYVFYHKLHIFKISKNKRKFVKREALINDPKKVVIELHYTENSHKDVWHWNN